MNCAIAYTHTAEPPTYLRKSRSQTVGAALAANTSPPTAVSWMPPLKRLPSPGLLPSPRSAVVSLEEDLDHVNRHREDGGRVLLGRDLGQGLQVAQLQRHRLGRHDLRRLGQLLRGLQLPF